MSSFFKVLLCVFTRLKYKESAYLLAIALAIYFIIYAFSKNGMIFNKNKQ